MKKLTVRLGSILLAISLLCTTAFAASSSPFSDVSEGSYYYSQVVEMYNDGVVNGVGNGRFDPYANVTRIQAIAMLCRLAKIDTSGYASTTEWYSGAENWALAAGVVETGMNLTRPATREEVAQFIVSIFELPLTNSTDGFTDTTSLYANTLKAYGISDGMVTTDGKVIFGGSQNIQRCDMCIMLSRLKANVPMPDRSDVKLIPGKIDGAFSFEDTLVSFPKSAEEYRSNMRYIMKNGQTQFKVNYENVKLTKSQYEELVDTVLGNAYYAFNRAYEDYPQYAMFYDAIGVEWSYQRWDGYYISVCFTISITPNSEVLAGTLHSHITSMELQCREIINDMYKSGTLKSSMTYKEKARVLYGYVTDRFTYDLNYVGAIPTICLRDNRAVCSGYTYIYAALCQMAGVPMFAENGYCGENNDYGGHTWNVITDNGETYYIDATWADMDIKGRPNMSFFWLTQSELQEIDPGRRVEDIVEYDS